MIFKIRKANKVLRGTVALTPSKSISNRVLMIRALCNDFFQIQNLATASDTLLLQKLLNSSAGEMNAEDAGTSLRFLTAYLAQKPGAWLLTGTERMKQRPIGMLVDGLKKLGAEISYSGMENFPPLKIIGKKLHGGAIEMDGSISSQFISALLLIAPTLENGLKLNLNGTVFSKPYIEMTLKLMNEFGVVSEWSDTIIYVKEQAYMATDFSVESDWSAASYWYEMAALSDEADLTLTGLHRDSVQGDSVIAEIMNAFGVESESTKEGIRIVKNTSDILPKIFSYNFQSCPDLVQNMAVTCAALGVEADFTGVQNLRIKETDRLTAMQNEFKKMAVDSHVSDNGFQIPDSVLKFPDERFQTHRDHRMAMSLAPLALMFGEIDIENPAVVNKSYPEFWNQITECGFQIEGKN